MSDLGFKRGKLNLKGTKVSKVNASSNRKSEFIGNNNSEAGGSSKVDANLTEAQKRFLKRKEETDKRCIEKLTSKSYRDRVEDFNQRLSQMTEHNDIPRISAAGNG